MNISIMLLSVFLTSFGYAQENNCYTNLNQDMNCNTIDVQEEGVVDLLHPECDPDSLCRTIILTIHHSAVSSQLMIWMKMEMALHMVL